MADQPQDLIQEFLVESYENLARLDREMVELEGSPHESGLLDSIFRTVHTIKGTCGFLGFPRLEALAHQAEDLLSQLRDGRRELNPALVSLILDTGNAIRGLLGSIEATGEEGPDSFENLRDRLRAAAQASAVGGGRCGVEDTEAAAAPTPAAPTPAAKEALSAEPRGAAPPAGGKSALVDANIRVGVGLLDKLMDLVGELVLTRNQILQFNAEREDAALNAASQRLNLITTELQGSVMKTRMQPIGVVWNKLPRVVRDLAVSLGKQIRLETEGAETELDRTIIEAIQDPLVHLVRNACDHGIEPMEARLRAGKPPQGMLTLRAYHEGGQVNIEIGDDGAGIDPARLRHKAVEKGLMGAEQAGKMSDRDVLNLVFHPGFSTAAGVTNVSGRGVGMDVVKSNIEKIGGIVDLSSRPGEGTTVKLKIPLTLAIIPGLVVSSGGERFLIPQASLLELVRLEGERRIERVHGTPVYRRRGSLLPVAFLNQVLGLAPAAASEAISMVVLQAEERQFGLVVDGINDTQEIVVKPLGMQLKGLASYAGATIMGDGRIALILDVLGVGQRSGVLAEAREQGRAAAEQKAQTGLDRERLLLFRAGSFDRLAVPLSLVARLEEFPRSSIERAGGCEVVQYRNRILPLVSLGEVLESGAARSQAPADPAQVIVFNDGERSLGVMVDGILDIAEERVTVRRNTSRKGLLGSAVVGKRLADFLDLNGVIRAAGEDWRGGTRGAREGQSILVAEASAFSRGLIRSSLEMAGYRVREAAGVEEALRELEQRPVDLVVAAVDLPPAGGRSLIAAMRQRPEWERIPVLALAESAQDAGAREAGDCQSKFDREAMLESVARLASAVACGGAVPVGAGEEK